MISPTSPGAGFAGRDCPRPPTTRCGRWNTSASRCRSTCRSSRRRRSTAATPAAGLPIGLQIAGQRFDDLGVLQVSRAFELIRERAAALAAAAVRSAAPCGLTASAIRSRSRRGQPRALNDFVEGFIASEARAVNILRGRRRRRQPAGAGLLRGAAHVRGDRGRAGQRAALHRTRPAALAAGTPREQRFIEAVAAWVDGRHPARHRAARGAGARASARPGVAQARPVPLFNRGDSPGMLRSRWPRCRPPATCLTCTACSPSPGSNATCWSRPRPPRARRSRMRRKEPWAHHALAHVMLTQGRLARRTCRSCRTSAPPGPA